MIERVDEERGWLLHHRPYRETSLLLEVFSREHGRVGLVANGARRPKSRLRAVLQPFQPLLLSWSMRGELGTLRQAELGGTGQPLAGEALYAGFYANELLMRLCHRGDAHPELHDVYQTLLKALSQSQAPGAALRLFERDLLDAIGYGLQLAYEAETSAPVEADQFYHYDIAHGPRLAEAAGKPARISGASLIALREGRLQDDAQRAEAKRLLQSALKPLLEDRPLRSVETMRQLRNQSKWMSQQEAQ